MQSLPRFESTRADIRSTPTNKETTMALLRQCLQELRAKHHERDAAAGASAAWGTLMQQPLREPSLPGHADRNPGSRAIASHRRPAA
jgi:hypothetical protein